MYSRKNGNELYKKRVMHVPGCCFAYSNLLFFYVFVAVASLDLKVPSLKIMTVSYNV